MFHCGRIFLSRKTFSFINFRPIRRSAFPLLCASDVKLHYLIERKLLCSENEKACKVVFHKMHFSGSSGEDIDSVAFEKVCSETLDSLCEFFEFLIEDNDSLKGSDVVYSDGVLTVNFGPKFGTYVINRQSPNKQIWLSSPKSGPKRYDYLAGSNQWVYKHDSGTLHSLLENEISSIVGKKINLVS